MKGLMCFLALSLSSIATVSIAETIPSLAHAEENDPSIQIYVPETSENGSFVIKVAHPKQLVDEGKATQIELWRSYNGGQFELISAHPQFNAISQMVNKQGTYAYQARVVRWEDGAKVADDVSDTSYIEVNLRYPTNYTRFQPKPQR